MPVWTHARNTVVLFGASDLSTYLESSDWNNGVGTEKVTAYSPSRTREEYGATLGDGKITFKGTASADALGPEAVLEPLMDAGAPVTLTFRPKGIGAGKPQKIVDVLITAVNTSHPVAGYVKFTVECQMTGTINRTPQS
jgi:hypothetical protein